MIERIKVGNVDVVFEDYEKKKGKIIISDNYGHNYSSYWGAMGGTIKEFVKGINHDYLANNLLSTSRHYVFCEKLTFTALRRHIKEEFGLNYFEHMEFQKDMREKINDFQRECGELGEQYFVHAFESGFVDRLDFFLIEDSFDRKHIESCFNGFCEVWNLIDKRTSDEYKWIKNFHKELKKVI